MSKVRLEDYEDETEGLLLLACQKDLESVENDDFCSVECRCRKHSEVVFGASLYLDNLTVDEVCKKHCPERLR